MPLHPVCLNLGKLGGSLLSLHPNSPSLGLLLRRSPSLHICRGEVKVEVKVTLLTWAPTPPYPPGPGLSSPQPCSPGVPVGEQPHPGPGHTRRKDPFSWEGLGVEHRERGPSDIVLGSRGLRHRPRGQRRARFNASPRFCEGVNTDRVPGRLDRGAACPAGMGQGPTSILPPGAHIPFTARPNPGAAT